MTAGSTNISYLSVIITWMFLLKPQTSSGCWFCGPRQLVLSSTSWDLGVRILPVAATDAPSSADQPRGPGILSPYFPDSIKNSNDFTGVCLGVKGDLTVAAFLKKKKKENYLFIYLAASALRCGKDLALQLEALVAACRLSCSMACEILIPKPWIKPRSPTPARQTLNLWTTREVPS